MIMKSEIEFLVTVPTWQRSEMLPALLDSLHEQLYVNWKLLILDDCSEDDTESVVCELQRLDSRVFYKKSPVNSGCNSARNELVNWSRAINPEGWVIIMDDDDLLISDALLHLAENIEANPESRWFSMTCLTNSSSKVSYSRKYGLMSYLSDYMFGNNIRGDLLHCIRADVIKNACFTDVLRNGEEWHFYCLLGARENLFMLESPGLQKNYQKGGLSDTGINRDRRRQVLELKLKTLEPLVGSYLLCHQYVSLASLELKDGNRDRAGQLLAKVWKVAPGYIRQYRHWIHWFFAGIRS